MERHRVFVERHLHCGYKDTEFLFVLLNEYTYTLGAFWEETPPEQAGAKLFYADCRKKKQV